MVNFLRAGAKGPVQQSVVPLGLRRRSEPAISRSVVDPKRVGGGQLLQRTTWTYTAGDWEKDVPDTGGRNRYPKPKKFSKKKFKEGDTFDQTTGELVEEGAVGHIHDYVGSTAKKGYGAWYGSKRSKTAYSYTSGTGGQGPHTFPHIGKRAMAEASVYVNKGFDPSKIRTRSGILPSAGQNRRLIREYETNSGQVIPNDRKRKLDQGYTSLLDSRESGSAAKRRRATAEAMEMNAMATYGHGRNATAPELKNKNENRDDATQDLTTLASWDKGTPRPAVQTLDGEDFTQSFFGPGAFGFQPDWNDKYFRDIGAISRGDDDLSEFELTSDEEYSDEEEESSSEDSI